MKFIASSLDVEKYLNININEYFLIKNISTDTRSMDRDSFFIDLESVDISLISKHSLISTCRYFSTSNELAINFIYNLKVTILY